MPEILRGSEPRFEDMVRYMESVSEGLAYHFAVADDELRLKTNIRGGPLPAHLPHWLNPAKVSLVNSQPAFSFGGENRS